VISENPRPSMASLVTGVDVDSRSREHIESDVSEIKIDFDDMSILEESDDSLLDKDDVMRMEEEQERIESGAANAPEATVLRESRRFDAETAIPVPRERIATADLQEARIIDSPTREAPVARLRTPPSEEQVLQEMITGLEQIFPGEMVSSVVGSDTSSQREYDAQLDAHLRGETPDTSGGADENTRLSTDQQDDIPEALAESALPNEEGETGSVRSSASGTVAMNINRPEDESPSAEDDEELVTS